MKGTESLQERSKRFSKIWSASRTDAKKSQDFMATGLGVSKKTIQNWERGVCAPDFFTGSEWFRVLGVNPIPYYLAFLYPEVFDGISPEDEDDVIDQAILLLIKNSTSAEKRQLLYLMAGRHGSPWYSLLQLFTAYCHTEMRSRVPTAHLIMENYDMDKRLGRLVCPSNIQPDMDILNSSYKKAKKSVIKNSKGYTNATPDYDDDEFSNEM